MKLIDRLTGKADAQPQPAPRRVLVGVPKLTDDQAREVAARLDAGESEDDLAAEFTVDPRTIRAAAERARRSQQVQRAQPGAAPAASADPELADLERQLRAEEYRVKLEAIRSDPDFRDRLLYGSRPKALTVDVIEQVHQHDSAEGWVRISKDRLEQLQKAEAERDALRKEVDKLQRDLDRLRMGSPGKAAGLAQLTELLNSPGARDALNLFRASIGGMGKIAAPGQGAQEQGGAQGQAGGQPEGAQQASTPPAKAEAEDPLRQLVREALEGKGPEERAKWLASHELAAGWIDQVCGIPDEVLYNSVKEWAATSGIPLAGWIVDQGETWLLDTVRELRKLKEAGS